MHVMPFTGNNPISFPAAPCPYLSLECIAAYVCVHVRVLISKGHCCVECNKKQSTFNLVRIMHYPYNDKNIQCDLTLLYAL